MDGLNKLNQSNWPGQNENLSIKTNRWREKAECPVLDVPMLFVATQSLTKQINAQAFPELLQASGPLLSSTLHQ